MLRGTTFGSCRFETSSTRIEPDSDVHFAILLLLSAAPPDGMSRDRITSILWPRASDAAAKHCLRQALYRIRRLDAPLRVRAGQVAIARDALTCDLHAFLHGAPARDEILRLGALPLLPAYTPRLGDEFAHWIEGLRADVTARLRRLLTDELAAARARARFHEVGQIARALLVLDPLNEVGTLGLAESLAFEGSKVDAIRLLEDYEAEVGSVSEALRIPPRLLRQRVAECLDDSILPRRFEIPFVGREREFGMLRELFREVREVEARCVVLTGEAGIGKTRLTTEMMRLAALDGATVGSYSASAGDTFTPVSTLVSVGQLLLSLPGALGCAHEHLHYVRRLGTPETVSAWSVSGMAADIAYAQLVYSLAELVRALADEAPLALFIDDAQRLHQTTWRVLFDLLDRVRDDRVMLLLATRRLPAWFGNVCGASTARMTHQLRLAPFNRDESLAFMRLWSDKNRVLLAEEDASTCATTSAGNPFYLGELAGHVGRGGDVRLAPKSIRELIELQHAAISKGAQRLLLVIALLQSRATLSRVTQILEPPADDFMAWLDEVEEAGLVASQGSVLRCKHDLVADAALALSMHGVQTYARVRIAEHLEREADDTNSVELLGDCVTHWELSGETRRAYQAAMKLGHRLVALGMGEDAERAFLAAKRTSDSAHDKLAALEGLIAAGLLCARWGRVSSLVDEHAELRASESRPGNAPDGFGLIRAEAMMFSLETTPDPANLLEIAECDSQPQEIRIRAATLAAIHGDINYDREAVTSAHSSIRNLANGGECVIPHSLFNLVYHTSVGEAGRVATLASEYTAHALASDDMRTVIQGLRRASNALIRVGLHQEARHFLRESLSLSRRLKLPMQEFACIETEIWSLLAMGESEEVPPLLGRLKEIASRSPSTHANILLFVARAFTAWQRHDTHEATELLATNADIESFLPQSVAHGIISARLALHLLVRDDEPLETDMELCKTLHRRGRTFGAQDLRTEILVNALTRQGKRGEADSLLDAFLREHRRELSPPMILRRSGAHHVTGTSALDKS